MWLFRHQNYSLLCHNSRQPILLVSCHRAVNDVTREAGGISTTRKSHYLDQEFSVGRTDTEVDSEWSPVLSVPPPNII